MTIRFAGHRDIPALIQMGQHFHSSSPYANLVPLDLATVERTGRTLIDGEDSAIIIALSGEQRIDIHAVGMLGLAVYSHPISGVRVASELFWWVEPEFRGHTGLKLLRLAEKWAVSRGAKVLQMIAPTVQTEQLYNRLGYTKVETSYQLGLEAREGK